MVPINSIKSNKSGTAASQATQGSPLEDNLTDQVNRGSHLHDVPMLDALGPTRSGSPGGLLGGTRALIIQTDDMSNQWPFTMYYMPAIVVCEAEDAIKIGSTK